MPRKGPAPRRELMPDPVHRSVLVTQIVNKVLLRGKRSVAEKIVYDALGTIEQRSGSEPIATLKRAVDNVKPPLEVKSRRAGGGRATRWRRRRGVGAGAAAGPPTRSPSRSGPAGPTRWLSAGSSASPA